MSFTNAYRGIKKIFAAELMILIATLATYAISGLNATSPGKYVEVFGIVGIAAGVLLIIAFILNLVGLIQARKDESNFTVALVLTLISIALTAVVTALPDNKLLADYGDPASNLLRLLTAFFVIQGVIAIARKLGKKNMVSRGKNIITLVVGIWFVVIALEVVLTILGSNETLTTIAGIIGIAALVALVIVYFLYLSYLGKAKTMLEK